MRGRAYFRHTVYHSVDNQQKIKNLNNNFKEMAIRNAVEYLKMNRDKNISDKLAYLNNLTLNNYRYGTKYKYNCNLNSTQISYIIRSANDGVLFEAYFGKTIEEYEKSSSMMAFGVFGFLLAVFAIWIITKVFGCM